LRLLSFINATIIKQTVEFNKKFDNYKGKTIRGSELLSVINRIVDYNNTEAGLYNYDRVIITVDLKNHEKDLLYTGYSGEQLFSATITNAVNDNEIRRISNLSGSLTSTSAGIPNITELKLQKLTSEIANIVEIDSYSGDAQTVYKEKIDKTIKTILKNKLSNNEELTATEINNVVDAVKKYYQLQQFKRAMFECKRVSYNTENGRVNNISFEVKLNDEGTYIEFD